MKILVPLDGSHFAEAVLTPAARLAASSHAEVHLVQVVKPSEARPTYDGAPVHESSPLTSLDAPSALGGSVPEVGVRFPAETQIQAQERLLQQARDYLAHVNEGFFSGGADVEAILGEDIARSIADVAERLKVDLIAIATHGRTGLARLMMGSVSGALLQAKAGPILMVRPEGLNE